jgi:hypothetical protein
LIIDNTEKDKEPSIRKQKIIDAMTGVGIFLAFILGLGTGITNAIDLTNLLSGQPQEEHIFPDTQDLFNIAYWCLRTLFAATFILVLAKLIHKTWKVRGSLGFHAMHVIYITVVLLGNLIFLSREIKTDAYGVGLVNDAPFYLTTYRMYICWEVCEYSTNVIIIFMVYKIATQ